MKDFNIHEDGNNVLTESVLNGIDANNIILDAQARTGIFTWTATEDCILYATFSTGRDATYPSSLQVNYHEILVTKTGSPTLPIKKGDYIWATSNGNQTMSFKAFGIKR